MTKCLAFSAYRTATEFSCRSFVALSFGITGDFSICPDVLEGHRQSRFGKVGSAWEASANSIRAISSPLGRV